MIALFFLAVWVPFLTVLRGISVAVFWNWFIAGDGAAFEGSAPTIGIVQGLGISLVVAFLTYQFHNDSNGDRDADEVIGAAMFKGIAFYAMFWVMAIIYHAFL